MLCRLSFRSSILPSHLTMAWQLTLLLCVALGCRQAAGAGTAAPGSELQQATAPDGQGQGEGAKGPPTSSWALPQHVQGGRAKGLGRSSAAAAARLLPLGCRLQARFLASPRTVRQSSHGQAACPSSPLTAWTCLPKQSHCGGSSVRVGRRTGSRLALAPAAGAAVACLPTCCPPRPFWSSDGHPQLQLHHR